MVVLEFGVRVRHESEWIVTMYRYQFLCGIDNLLHSAAAG